jgi:Arc/MetJ-type ribon-helix-helix transcriptional regulator
MGQKKSTSLSLTKETLEKIEDIQEFKDFSNRSETIEELVDEVHRLGFGDAIDDATDKTVRGDGGAVDVEADADDESGWHQPIDKFDLLVTVGGVSLMLGVQQWTVGNIEAMAVYGVAASTLLGIAGFQTYTDGE